MGLDMSLYATVHFRKEEEYEWQAKIVPALAGYIDQDEDDSTLVSASFKFEVGYWRGAYPIHDWFLDLPHRRGTRGTGPVKRDSLKELLAMCRKIKDRRPLAFKLIPDVEPEEVEHTIKVLKLALALPEEFVFEYDYC